MLSGETTMGLFPVEAVAMMKRVIMATEGEQLREWTAATHEFGAHDRANAISAAATVLASQLPAKIIVAETASGQTALNIACLRPAVPIIMVTDRRRTYNQLAIVWGGKSYLHADPAAATEHVVRQLRIAAHVAPGDAYVVASGNQPGVTGGTNTVSVRVI